MPIFTDGLPSTSSAAMFAYYGLHEQPFGVTSDPRFLYLSPTHREALATLFSEIECGRGVIVLVGKPGMGKTTLLFRTLQHFRNSDQTAFVFQTQCSSRDFLAYVLRDLGVKDTSNRGVVDLHEQLREMLRGINGSRKRLILVVDEAQNLNHEVLETIRLLSNFETPQAKLIQIVLSGQEQLESHLALAKRSQLRQRISSFCKLEPMPPKEVANLVNHRLRIAGYYGEPLFTPDALSLIAARSGGIPREINNYCYHALALGYVLHRRPIDAPIIYEVAHDLKPTEAEEREDPQALEEKAEIERELAKQVNESVCIPERSFPEVGPDRPLIEIREEGLATEEPKKAHEPDPNFFVTPEPDPYQRPRPTREVRNEPWAWSRVRAITIPIAAVVIIILLLWTIKQHSDAVVKPMEQDANSTPATSPQANVTVDLPESPLNSKPDSIRSEPAPPVTSSAFRSSETPPRRSATVKSPIRKLAVENRTTEAPAGVPLRSPYSDSSKPRTRATTTLRPPTKTPAPEPAAPSMSEVPSQTQRTSLTRGEMILPSFGSRVAKEERPGSGQRSSALVMGALRKRVAPEYPSLAREAGITGTVVLLITVQPDGSVGDVRVVSGNQALVPAAIVAVRQWEYGPSYLDEHPIAIQSEVRFRFE